MDSEEVLIVVTIVTTLLVTGSIVWKNYVGSIRDLIGLVKELIELFKNV